MKKNVNKTIFLILCLTLLTNCKKYGRNFDTYFYTDIDSMNDVVYLYIDGANNGILPNNVTVTANSNDSILKKANHLTLKSGNYELEGRNFKGDLLFKGNLKFRKNTMGTSSTKGSITTTHANQIIVIKIST